MGLLDGGGAAIMSAVFGGIFLDATLHRATFTDDGSGGGSTTYTNQSVKAQLEAATQAMREAEGYVDTDMRIIVLAHGVMRPTSDDEITIRGVRYGIANVGTDPAQAYWDLHGRLAG